MRYLVLLAALFALSAVANLPTEMPEPARRQAPNPVVAFPGAYGTGKFAMNRCVQNALADPSRVHIFRVTNLDGDWNATPHVPGSWYAALDSVQAKPAGDLKFIVADTSGLIQLIGPGESTQYELDCTWIAGQTAQGGGITFWSGTGSRTGFTGGSNDVVVEYVRTRNARANMFGLSSGEVNDSIGPAIINHVSMCYARHTGGGGGQLVVNVSSYVREVTVQNAFLCSPDAIHPTIVYCVGSHAAALMRDCTIARNFIVGGPSVYRCPLINAGPVFVINNVTHGCRTPVMTSNGSTIDIVANFTLVRPGISLTSVNAKWSFEDNCADDEFGLPGPTSHLDCPRSIYIAGNRTDQNGFIASTPADSMYIGSKQSIVAEDVSTQSFNWPSVTFDGDTVPVEWRRDTALVENYDIYPVPEMTDVFRDDSVVAMAGVMRLLACDGTWRTASPGGTWTAIRDSLDQQHVTWFENALAQTPPYIPTASWDQTTGLTIPVPPAAPKCADTDGDAAPDAWEKRWMGVNDSISIDPKVDSDGDGFLNFVEYLHNTDPTTFTNFDGTEGGVAVARFWLRRDSLHQFTASGDSACQAYPTDSIANPVSVWRKAGHCTPSSDVLLKTWGDSLTEGLGVGVYLLPLNDAQLDSICGAWTSSASDSTAACAVIRAWRAPGQP